MDAADVSRAARVGRRVGGREEAWAVERSNDGRR